MKALIAKYAIARGDLLLKRRGQERFASPDVFAGWALERSGGDVLRALQLVQGLRIAKTQRREVLDVLRPLTMVLDLTKPFIQLAGHR